MATLCGTGTWTRSRTRKSHHHRCSHRCHRCIWIRHRDDCAIFEFSYEVDSVAPIFSYKSDMMTFLRRGPIVSVLLAGGAIMAALSGAHSQSYQSNKYPAGLHPSLCPHYPYCDNAVLGGFARGVAAIHHGGSDVPGYPASLSPHACPNYPYCSHQIPAEAINYRRSVPSGHQFAAAATDYHATHLSTPSAKYPSGLDPAACPNYPYCH